MADNTLTADLIDDILKGNLNAAENALHQTLTIKQNNALDQEKIKLSGQIFNNQPIEDDEDEDEELSDEEIDDIVDGADEEDLLDDEDLDDETSEDEEDE